MSSSLSLVKIYNELSHDLFPNYIESCWQKAANIKPHQCLAKANPPGSHLEWSFGASIALQLISKIVCNLALDLVFLGILVTFTINSKNSVFVLVLTQIGRIHWNDETMRNFFSHGDSYLFSVQKLFFLVFALLHPTPEYKMK